MLKSQIRKEFLQRRNNLSSTERDKMSRQIFENFISKFPLKRGQKIHLFLKMDKFNEIDTQLFIDYFFEKGIRIFVPKVSGEKISSLELFPSTILKKNKWGIWEPDNDNYYPEKDFDYIITPLLYCDNKGNRVGYGKGYYDSFFRTLEKPVIKIGLNYFAPEFTISDNRKEDIPLDYLVLPDETLSFLGL
jgi:5-formyltetrahydrofolate cyclo-ligase